MQEFEEREESVRVLREGAPDADREAVTIEKTKTIRKTIERPKRPSRKGASKWWDWEWRQERVRTPSRVVKYKVS
jgi:hypothetical protein